MSADQPEKSAQNENDGPAENETPADETKRKFREALAAKKGRHGEDHLDGGQSQGHAHGRIETKRTFRRKTG